MRQKQVTCPAIDGIIREAKASAGEVDDKHVLSDPAQADALRDETKADFLATSFNEALAYCLEEARQEAVTGVVYQIETEPASG
jgi:hypothetical protein